MSIGKYNKESFEKYGGDHKIAVFFEPEQQFWLMRYFAYLHGLWQIDHPMRDLEKTRHFLSQLVMRKHAVDLFDEYVNIHSCFDKS